MKKKKTYLWVMDKYKLLHTIPNYNFQLFNKWKWNVPENDNKLWSEFLYRHQKYLIKLSSLRVSSQSLRGVSEVSLVTSYSKSFLFRFTLSLSLCCSFFFSNLKLKTRFWLIRNLFSTRFTLVSVSIVINVTISFDLMRSSLGVFDLSFFSSQVIKAKKI